MSTPLPTPPASNQFVYSPNKGMPQQSLSPSPEPTQIQNAPFTELLSHSKSTTITVTAATITTTPPSATVAETINQTSYQRVVALAGAPIEAKLFKKEILDSKSSISVLGVGGYATVFKGKMKNGEDTAIKRILLNIESAAEIEAEILLTSALSQLPSPNLPKLFKVAIVKGVFPKSGNEKAKKSAESFLLCMSLGGTELENHEVQNKNELLSILVQVVLSNAIGEEILQMEHRDQHVSNILIESTKNAKTTYIYNGKQYSINTFGVLVKLIDFGNTRIFEDGKTIYKDLNSEEGLFGQNEQNADNENYQMDLHQDVYDNMLKENNGNWKKISPRSNVLWINYLIEKLTIFTKNGNRSKYSGCETPSNVDEETRKCIADALQFTNDCESAREVVERFITHDLFSAIFTAL